MISIKSKIWASASLIILLVIDQNIKMQMNYEKNQNITKNVATYEKIRTGIFIAIIGVAVIGFILYGLRAYREFGAEFSGLKLFFGTNNCNTLWENEKGVRYYLATNIVKKVKQTDRLISGETLDKQWELRKKIKENKLKNCTNKGLRGKERYKCLRKCAFIIKYFSIIE